MQKSIWYRFALTMLCLVILASCNKFRKIQKSDDWELKYKAAINYYEKGDYYRASVLFEQLLPIIRGTKRYPTTI